MRREPWAPGPGSWDLSEVVGGSGKWKEREEGARREELAIRPWAMEVGV